MRVSSGIEGFLSKFWKSVPGLRLRWILLTGIAIRMGLWPFTSETYDVSVWYYLGNDILKGLGIYASQTYTYPPLWAYTTLPLIWLLALLVNPISLGQIADNLAASEILPGSLAPIASPLFLIILKTPLFLADLGGAFLIYAIVNELVGQKQAKAALMLWLLNPSIIWTSFGHGQFDVIPAVLTLASGYLIFRKHIVSSGTALGLAILYKLYPLFFVPLYLVLLLYGAGEAGKRNRLRLLLRFSAALIIPALLFSVIPVFLPTSAGAGFLDTIGARGSLIPYIGGFSPLSIINLPEFHEIKQAFILNSGIVNAIIITVQVILSIFIALITRRRMAIDPLASNLLGHVLVIAVILVTTPLTNPQYLVWMIPFLIMLYGLKGEFLKRVWILSIVGFLLNLAWLGPGYFLYPSAIYFGLPSIGLLTSLNSAFAPFSIPIVTVCQIIAFLGIISFLNYRLSSLHTPASSNTVQAQIPHSRPAITINTRLPVKIETGLKLALIFLIASTAFVAVNPIATRQPSLTVTDYRASQGPTLTYARASLHFTGGTYPSEVDTLLLPLRSAVRQPPLYLYYDPAYPTSLTDLRGWTGMLDHLPFELQQRNYPKTSPLSMINAVELARLIKSNASAAIVLPSGVLPSTTNISELRSFLQNGGILFWIGDRIGYYSANPSLTLDETSPDNPRYGAQIQLFNGTVVFQNTTSLDGTPYDAGTLTTNLSRALNLNYPVTLVGAGLPSLAKVGGTALGRINERTNQTSIAVIPVGSGKAVIFGGGVMNQFTSSGETEIASDVAQIMAGGLLDSTFEFSLHRQMVPARQTVNATIELYVNTTEVIIGVLLISYSPNPYVSFFFGTAYPAKA